MESQDTNEAPLEYYRPDSIAAGERNDNTRCIDRYSSINIEKESSAPSQTVSSNKESAPPRVIKRPRTTQGSIDILLTKKAETESLKRQWNQVVLENTSGFVHVLSLKGIFLYCSRSTSKLLEYDPSELVGTSISKLCHPSDVIPVMRELKESSNSKVPINLIYRIKRKHSGYIWIECHGRLDLEQGKGRKCVILSGRSRPVYQLARQQITAEMEAPVTSDEPNDFDDYQFWGKLSVDGLFLYATSSTATVVGMKSDELIGLSIYQVIRDEQTADVAEALRRAREGETANVRHHVRSMQNEEILVDSSFYPGNTSQGEGNPAFILIQVRYAEDDNAKSSRFISSHASISVDTGTQSDTSSDSETSNEEKDESNDSDSIPTCHVGASETPTEENLFCELETMRSTSWQFEIHQMRLTNKRLREKIRRIMKRSAS
jgi:PAS domain-containing protein